MAVVNALKINDTLGYVISDEEYWSARGLRRTYHSDNLHLLLDPGLADIIGMNVVLGFVGSPTFGMELVEVIKQELAHREKEKKGEFPKQVQDIAHLANRLCAKLVKEKVNQRLAYMFGFDLDELNQGFFKSKDKQYTIKQSDVLKHALQIINRKDAQSSIKDIIKTEILFMGYDGTDGMNIFSIAPEEGVLIPAASIFESIGIGADVSNLIFAGYLNKIPLSRRREGIDPIEGLLQTFWSVNEAGTYNHQVGGYCHLGIIDKSRKKPEQRVRMFAGHKAKLGSDAVKAFKMDLLDHASTCKILQGLFFEDMEFAAGEDMLFKKCRNSKQLDYMLRGYKSEPALAANKGGNA